MQCTNSKCPHYRKATPKKMQKRRRFKFGGILDEVFRELPDRYEATGCSYGYCKLNERKGGPR